MLWCGTVKHNCRRAALIGGQSIWPDIVVNLVLWQSDGV